MYSFPFNQCCFLTLLLMVRPPQNSQIMYPPPLGLTLPFFACQPGCSSFKHGRFTGRVIHTKLWEKKSTPFYKIKVFYSRLSRPLRFTKTVIRSYIKGKKMREKKLVYPVFLLICSMKMREFLPTWQPFHPHDDMLYKNQPSLLFLQLIL